MNNTDNITRRIAYKQKPYIYQYSYRSDWKQLSNQSFSDISHPATMPTIFPYFKFCSTSPHTTHRIFTWLLVIQNVEFCALIKPYNAILSNNIVNKQPQVLYFHS